jgi:ATP-dependent helicase YprA (DUF1998 family)
MIILLHAHHFSSPIFENKLKERGQEIKFTKTKQAQQEKIGEILYFARPKLYEMGEFSEKKIYIYIYIYEV